MADIAETHLIVERVGDVGFLTFNRPNVLNALSIRMVRDLSAALVGWRDDESVKAVAIRGMGRDGPFGVFCAGGDIRFLHRSGIAGDIDAIDGFFTEEYRLDHVIHHYPKPVIAFMDGIVMGGGMGIAQGASYRIVTERTRMAMPETAIGLFPDVAAGYFLSRCPGRIGEWLALTGDTIDGTMALACGLADAMHPSASVVEIWEELGSHTFTSSTAVANFIATKIIAACATPVSDRAEIDYHFGQMDVMSILCSLDDGESAWACRARTLMRKRSPLMMNVALAQIRRGRSMSLADDLRMERGLVHHCFHPSLEQSETMEGIRALVIDKDQAPRWRPALADEVTSVMVEAFFKSPWSEEDHPLRDLN